MEALARTMELLDRLRDGMQAAGLDKNNVLAGLVYYQPKSKGAHLLAQTTMLPEPSAIGAFCDAVMGLEDPRFLGVIFIQHDPDAEKASQKGVVFVWPFMSGPEADGRLLAARNELLEELRTS